MYSVFVDDVAKFRGVEIEQVLEGMADGRIFHGRQAIEAGLVDGVATMAETVALARDMARSKGKQTKRPAGAVAAINPTKENHMDIELFKAEQPELYAAIVAEAQAGTAALVATARAEGATAESQRIKDVRAQLLPGHEALVEELAFDGKSTAADAAIAIVNAEKCFRVSASAAIEADANPAVPSVDADADQQKTIKRAAFNALLPHEQAATAKAGIRIID